MPEYKLYPSNIDYRDHYFRTISFNNEPLPYSIDLIDKLPAIQSQLNIGSCLAHALNGAVYATAKRPFLLSRLMLYYLYRDDKNADNGGSIRDGLKVLANIGYSREKYWPYKPEKFAIEPTSEAFFDASKNKISAYQRIENNSTLLCSALAHGCPIVVGMRVYESFESKEFAKTGVMKMPESNEKILGAHAVLITAYDMESKTFTIRNSWGKEWADNGYFTVPFEFVENDRNVFETWIIKF
jgi:C1A family cysteine protease